MNDFFIFLALGILSIIFQSTFFSFHNYSPDPILLLAVYKGCSSSSKIKDFLLVFLLGYLMDLFDASKMGAFSSFLILSFLLCLWLNLKFNLERLLVQAVICFMLTFFKGLFLPFIQGNYSLNFRGSLIHSSINSGLTPFVFPLLKRMETHRRREAHTQ